MIQELPLEKNSIHNIRLRFAIKDFGSLENIIDNSSFKINPFSKDIQLASWQIVKDIFVGVSLHGPILFLSILVVRLNHFLWIFKELLILLIF